MQVQPWFILYVFDQRASTAFYTAVLAREPRLDVPGMTEFDLSSGAVLGLMPAAGIRRLLGSALTERESSASGLRAELYLFVDDAEGALARATAAGARLLSPVSPRDWGHRAGYCRDRDGYILAFASAVDPV